MWRGAVIEPGERAIDIPSNVATQIIEIDEERGDLTAQSAQGCPIAGNPSSCLTDIYSHINSIVGALSPSWVFNFRCDDLTQANGNAALSACNSTSIPTIRSNSHFNKQLIYMTASGSGVLSSFLSQAAISNGDATGMNPPSCTSSFYTQTGLRVLLSNLSPSDWKTINSSIISACGTGYGVNLLEDAPNGQRLGGLACDANNNPVLNPEKWAEGGGFASRYPCFSVNVAPQGASRSQPASGKRRPRRRSRGIAS